MDIDQTHRYFDRLFQGGDEFELLFTHPHGTRKVARVTRAWGGAESEGVLDDIRRAEEAGYNVYASAMPLGVQASGTYDRIWVDQDDPAAPWPFSTAPEWPSPTTLVYTSEEPEGYRWQAIWRLSEALPADKARRTMKTLASTIGADGSVHDPRRVLRVPGVLNAKRGTPATLVNDYVEARVDLAAFGLREESFIDRLLTSEVTSPNHVLGEWLAGVDEGDRSRKAYVAARFLKGCGVTFDDAAAILKVGAVRSNPAFGDQELLHTIQSAYGRN